MSMRMITTEAWVLHKGEGAGKPEPGCLYREEISFPDITEEEVLAEPLYGTWEANMSHAISRRPVDVCALRREERVVLGNSGVVRILRTGATVRSVRPGDVCILFAGLFDKHGFLKQGSTFGYDCPGSIGLLSRQTKLHESQLLLIPRNTRYSLKQWTAFSLRYLTAYNNWNLAYGCFRLQMSESDCPRPWVWGWGGGSTLAELELARLAGCEVAMLASHPERLELIRRRGILPLDRRMFPALSFVEEQYLRDPAYRRSYDEAERAFLDLVHKVTDGEGVSIFVDYIGAPVSRASMRALSRQGVLTTAGWKAGMKITNMRAIECIERHTHVHTHYARYADGKPAVELAERMGWMPEDITQVWGYDEIPELAKRYSEGTLLDYFPVFQVN